ncbi:MAG TPA: GerMN domain-containing protein, partial [Rectinemataceae bacterium]|nr:GerMN domain-containing protein [Rectinemataceae bacterium]
VWLSVPFNLCLAALAAVFLFSLVSWALLDRKAEVLLFFPDAKTSRIRGEVRDLPRAWGAEARAELVASEVLLGPRDSSLAPAFPAGTRVEAVLYRKGRLYVDISPEAAISEPSPLKLGLEALRRSLAVAVPQAARIALTIGGIEPYAEGIDEEPGNTAKNRKIN